MVGFHSFYVQLGQPSSRQGDVPKKRLSAVSFLLRLPLLFPKNLSAKSFWGALFAQRVRRLFSYAYQRTHLDESLLTRSARSRERTGLIRATIAIPSQKNGKKSHTYRADHYYVLYDLLPLVDALLKVNEEYKDKTLFLKKQLKNATRSAFFSSDRAIKTYAEKIWGI